jgi:ABC-type sugar transport system ATPase subunit
MIEFCNVSMKVGDFALNNLQMQIPRGAYAVLVGPTGSGKTSILEMLCGLKPVAAGKIKIAGAEITHLDPAERGIGYVPQEGALFPSMKIGRQIGLALEVRKVARKEIRERTHRIAVQLKIEHLLDRRPHGLSGGERQRIALARALVFQPDVLCLDEPLAALDEKIRESLYPLLRSLTDNSAATILHITHSTSEARRLASLGLRLDNGKLVPWNPSAEIAEPNHANPD